MTGELLRLKINSHSLSDTSAIRVIRYHRETKIPAALYSVAIQPKNPGRCRQAITDPHAAVRRRYDSFLAERSHYA